VVFLQELKPLLRFDVNVIKTTKAKKIVEVIVMKEPKEAIEFQPEKASG
jgi:phosphotransferase system IIA component